jgi:hypothetical protein
MRRHRTAIVCLCLLAMLWCQSAMAWQSWQGATSAEDAVEQSNCHGGKATPASDAEDCCLVGDLLPDVGKLPPFAALSTTAGWNDDRSRRAAPNQRCKTDARSRAGPDLARLCRLLI